MAAVAVVGMAVVGRWGGGGDSGVGWRGGVFPGPVIIHPRPDAVHCCWKWRWRQRQQQRQLQGEGIHCLNEADKTNGWHTTQGDWVVEDRTRGGGKTTQCEEGLKDMTQGKLVADDTMRRGGQRTQCKAIVRWWWWVGVRRWGKTQQSN